MVLAPLKDDFDRFEARHMIKMPKNSVAMEIFVVVNTYLKLLWLLMTLLGVLRGPMPNPTSNN